MTEQPTTPASSEERIQTLAELERLHICRTFFHFRGHREQTAKALGIGLRTLSGKLRAYGYQPRYRPPPRKPVEPPNQESDPQEEGRHAPL